MSSQRTRNRLYWALTNLVCTTPDQWKEHSRHPVYATYHQIKGAYIDACRGTSDREILRDPITVDILLTIEEIHGPAGIRQVHKDRPAAARQLADHIRDTYTPAGR